MVDVKRAVIPVAGMGTRLLPVTKSQPKEMLPLGRKPCVQHIVEEVAAAGCSEILFITGSNKRSIEEHFDIDQELRQKLQSGGRSHLLDDLKFEDMNVNFYYTRQKRASGLGDAVSYARGFTDDAPFIVALGDAVIENKDGSDSLLQRMLKVYEEKQPAFVVAVREVAPEQVEKYGILDIQEEESEGCFLINDLVEKPAVHEAPSNYAIAARYVFNPDLFGFLDRTLPGTGGEIQLTDAMKMMLKHDYSAYAVSLNEDEVRHDIGTFASYYQSFIHFALKDKEYGYRIKQYLQSIMDETDSEGRI